MITKITFEVLDFNCNDFRFSFNIGSIVLWMITKITFEVLDFNCNDFGFSFNIGVSYLGIFIKGRLHDAIKITI